MRDTLLRKALKLELEPVAISFSDDEPADAVPFGARGEEVSDQVQGQADCPATYLIAAGKGLSTYFDRDVYDGCDGGRLGLGFAKEYKNPHLLSCLLSTGDAALEEWGIAYPESCGVGERLYDSPETAFKSKQDYCERELISQRYVTFRPASLVPDGQEPDHVHMFVNPDQLSALVIMLGFHSGTRENINARFEAACHAVALSHQESLREHPRAVLGFFDLGPRFDLPKNLLSLTMTYKQFKELEESIPGSCLISTDWGRIVGRL